MNPREVALLAFNGILEAGSLEGAHRLARRAIEALRAPPPSAPPTDPNAPRPRSSAERSRAWREEQKRRKEGASANADRADGDTKRTLANGGDTKPNAVANGVRSPRSLALAPVDPSGSPSLFSASSPQGSLDQGGSKGGTDTNANGANANATNANERTSGDYSRVVDCYFAAFKRTRNKSPAFTDRDGKAIKQLIAAVGADEACATIEDAFGQAWFRDTDGTITTIAKDPNRFRGAPERPSGTRAAALPIDLVRQPTKRTWEASE